MNKQKTMRKYLEERITFASASQVFVLRGLKRKNV